MISLTNILWSKIDVIILECKSSLLMIMISHHKIDIDYIFVDQNHDSNKSLPYHDSNRIPHMTISTCSCMLTITSVRKLMI
jgi:hypothetical protein